MRRRLDRNAGHGGIPHGIVDLVELPELGHPSFRLVGKEPRRLVGGHRLHGNPGRPTVIVYLVTDLPELPITVDVILQRNLLPNDVSHTTFHQLVKLGRVVGSGCEEFSHVGGIGQPACVGGENPSFTALHDRAPRFRKSWMPTVPGVAAQSAIVSATPGSTGSTGLTRPNRPGCCRWTASA